MAMGENLLLDAGNLRQATGYILGAVSGAMTVITADSDVFALRNVSTSCISVNAIRIRWVTSTAFGSAQSMAFRVHKVYTFTAVHSAGSPTAIQTHYKRQSQIRGTATGDRVPLTDLSALIAGTAAMTSGTYATIDADEPELLAVGAGSTLPGIYEEWAPADGLPLVLEQNQGIVVKNHILMGAAGVGNLFVGLELSRATPQ
jgi:hypothetical protein